MAKSKKQKIVSCPDCIVGVFAADPDCPTCNGTGVWSDEEPQEKFFGRYDYS